ncbi:hypothetical protein [Shinella sp.]|uniref:hypothetical protein n=1 Tax=Shinella sp. TaxID=1870904 RepID=UPI0029ADA74C|nr:hypothetical protein [Shinella sp.]MDX3978928.1 hypothetical protein [Shinella sp.]
MSKRQSEIDMPHPLFIPARRPLCTAAQTVLIFSTAFLGLVASLKRDMARAIRECPFDRPAIAARMAGYLAVAGVSKATLDAYTAESATAHDISLVRFKAFVRATGATWLWDTIVSDDGLLLLEGDEARLAEIARIQQERRALTAELKVLQATPVTIRRGRT